MNAGEDRVLNYFPAYPTAYEPGANPTAYDLAAYPLTEELTGTEGRAPEGRRSTLDDWGNWIGLGAGLLIITAIAIASAPWP